MKNDKLSLTLVAQVKAAHSKVLRCAGAFEKSLISQVNAAREAGLYLQQLREQTRHGEWEALFAGSNRKPAFGFTVQTARTYIRLSEELKQPVTELPQAVTCLKDVLVAAGALPEPQRGQQQSRGALGWVSQFTKGVMTLQAIIGKERDKADVREWKPEVRQEIKMQIEPFVELYRML